MYQIRAIPAAGTARCQETFSTRDLAVECCKDKIRKMPKQILGTDGVPFVTHDNVIVEYVVHDNSSKDKDSRVFAGHKDHKGESKFYWNKNLKTGTEDLTFPVKGL